MSPKKRFQLMVEPKQLERLRHVQAQTGAPVAVIIRQAIDDELDRAERLLGVLSGTVNQPVVWADQTGTKKAERKRTARRKHR